MNAYNVLLIGTGQIGSRHLQGLAKCKIPLNICLIESRRENLLLAVERFYEAEPLQHNFISLQESSLDKLPPYHFNLVISATNADLRAFTTKQLVRRHKVDNIIFEKVAFQSENQFEEIIHILKKNSIKSWVNCTRRFFQAYINLREELKDQGPIIFKLTGSDWGLACNSVHFLDLFCFLISNEQIEVTEINLENKIYESKRKGYIEFYGSFMGSSINGSQFEIRCDRLSNRDDKIPIRMVIEYKDKYLIIEEGLGRVRYYMKTQDISYREESIVTIYQSKLTNQQVEQIIKTGNSKLPELEESYNIHKPILQMFRSHYTKITGRGIQNIPIT